MASSVTIEVVSDDVKFADTLSINEKDLENDREASNSFGFLSMKMFKAKKVNPPPMPSVSIEALQEWSSKVLSEDNNAVVVYNKSDFDAFEDLVRSAGRSGAFIVTVETKEEVKELSKRFAMYSSVDVITRACSASDDFTYVFLGSVLKRALRVAGFME